MQKQHICIKVIHLPCSHLRIALPVPTHILQYARCALHQTDTPDTGRIVWTDSPLEVVNLI